MARAVPAVDHSVEGKLTVGSSADPDVIAELPVVKVVAAVTLRAGEGGHFVVFKPGRTREVVNGAPDIPEHFLIGQ